MSAHDDCGLGEVLDTIRTVLHPGALPESPGDKLKCIYRQYISLKYPKIVAAMLMLRAQSAGEGVASPAEAEAEPVRAVDALEVGGAP